MSRWSTLRRRLHHGDVDGRRREHYDYDTSDFGSLGEPLLSEYVDTHTHTQTQTHGDVISFLLCYLLYGIIVNCDNVMNDEFNVV